MGRNNMINFGHKTIVIAGARSSIARAFDKFISTNFPDFKIIKLYWESCSVQELARIFETNKIDYFVNFAALTDNKDSFNKPFEYFKTNSFGVLNQLEIIRKLSPKTRYATLGTVYEDDSSNNSPYSFSKRVAREIVLSYKNSYGLYAIQPTLGLTEYYYRKNNYLLKKIIKGFSNIKSNIDNNLFFDSLLINEINQQFNFLWAEDAAEGIWRALNQDVYRLDWEKNLIIKDYLIAGPFKYKLKKIIELVAENFGVEGYWISEQNTDKYIQARTGKILVSSENIKYPNVLTKFVDDFVDEAALISYQELNWTRKTPVPEMIKLMCEFEKNLIN